MANPHLHDATVKLGQTPNRPYHAQCSCGVGGDFGTRAEAGSYLSLHFAQLSGIAEHTLKMVAPENATPQQIAAAVAVKTPASHAVGMKSSGPPPPPPPPPSIAKATTAPAPTVEKKATK